MLSVKESRAAFDISMRKNPQNYQAAQNAAFEQMMTTEGRDRHGVIAKEKRGKYAEQRMAELAADREKYNVNHLGYYKGGVPQPNRGPIRGNALGRPGHFHSPQIHNFMNYSHGDSQRVTQEDAVKFKHFMTTDKPDFNRTMPQAPMYYDDDFNYAKDRDFWLKFLLGWTAVGYLYNRYYLEKDRAKMHERMTGFPNTPQHHVVNKGGILLKKEFTGFKKYYKSHDELMDWYKMVYPKEFK